MADPRGLGQKPSEMPDDMFNAYMQQAMQDSEGKLDMTNDERAKLMEAMKRPEFTQLMKDYMDEISDPKNRAEQEAYLRQLEAENRVPGHMKLVTPEPGFCVKVRRTEGEEKGKLFINICSLKDVEPYAEQQSSNRGGGVNVSLPYSLGPLRHENDKSGTAHPTFDFAMHPKTIERCMKEPRFQKLVMETAIDAVEKRIHEIMGNKIKVDRESARVLRGVACMGGKPAVMQIKNNDVKSTETASKPKVEAKKPIVEAVKPQVPANQPKYTITHRGHIDLADFVDSSMMAENLTIKRPKELVIRVQVPKVKSAKYLDIETSKSTFRLTCTDKNVADYELDLSLPYPVNEDKGSAKFDKQKRALEITLPVLPPSKEELEKAKERLMALKGPVKVVEQAKLVQEIQQEKQQETVVPREEPKTHDKWVGESNNEEEKLNEKDQEQEQERKQEDELSLEEIIRQAKEASKLPLPKAEDFQGEKEEQETKVPQTDLPPVQLEGDFVPSTEFAGARNGYVFKKGTTGLGYYKDILPVAEPVSQQPEKKETDTRSEDTVDPDLESTSQNTKPKLLQLQNKAIFELD